MTKTSRRASIIQNNDLIKFKEELKEYTEINIMNTDEDDVTYKLINKIHELPLYEQNIICLYAMIGSYTGVAKRLNVSVGIIHKYINEIIKKLK